jgi:bifunctional pyridoxal-dependent enzyme with beta-cystathionase and maltose regulon repressor activities
MVLPVPSLPVPNLAALRRRQSAKWRMHGPDVLPLSIAEMDFELAAPVVAALQQALADSDAGYAGSAGEPGERFGAAGAGHLRLNFATSEEILALAIGRMAGALRG